MAKPTTVDNYIADFPTLVQTKLQEIRAAIRETAPTAIECISYGMPAYKLNGKPLVYFGGYKNHIGFYATPTGHSAFVKELATYKQGKGSVQFPLSSPIPIPLIKRIVSFRVKEFSGKKIGGISEAIIPSNLPFLTKITEDLPNYQLHISRVFKAPIELVWLCWTDSNMLEKWWAPKPYSIISKAMDFLVGGRWHYGMKNPNGNIHWCLADYLAITQHEQLTYQDAFCDENGVPNTQVPSVHWALTFKQKKNLTEIFIDLSFTSEADLLTIIGMGFKEGFTMALTNLDELLESQS